MTVRFTLSSRGNRRDKLKIYNETTRKQSLTQFERHREEF